MENEDKKQEDKKGEEGKGNQNQPKGKGEGKKANAEPKKAKGPTPGQGKKPQEALERGVDLGITVSKETHLSEWYIQVIEKAELISYSDISGCYGTSRRSDAS
jgi:hypothetical protein